MTPKGKLCQGRIVWVWLANPQGKDPKQRPIVILTPDEQIETSEQLYGIVCSHSHAAITPRPDYYIPLSWNQTGTTKTKLRKETVALCNWPAAFNKFDVTPDNVGGVVSSEEFAAIVAKGRECYARAKQ